MGQSIVVSFPLDRMNVIRYIAVYVCHKVNRTQNVNFVWQCRSCYVHSLLSSTEEGDTGIVNVVFTRSEKPVRQGSCFSPSPPKDEFSLLVLTETFAKPSVPYSSWLRLLVQQLPSSCLEL